MNTIPAIAALFFLTLLLLRCVRWLGRVRRLRRKREAWDRIATVTELRGVCELRRAGRLATESAAEVIEQGEWDDKVSRMY